MKVYKDIPSLKRILREKRIENQSIGLVPTMGALHSGHLALIDSSQQNCDITVCSIYVNPTQFNNTDDLEQYPKSLQADLELLEKADCDVVFVPEDDAMYSQGNTLTLDFGGLEQVMEGKFRPNHFSGVGLVVSKLFNIVRPTHAFFGQKDFQQCAVIKKLVKELIFDIEIVIVPIVREDSGLAMSSRNRRLSDEGINKALIFFESLNNVKTDLRKGLAITEVKNKIKRNFAASNTKLEYLEVVDIESLEPLEVIHEPKQTAICIAGYVEKVRLIDNMTLE